MFSDVQYTAVDDGFFFFSVGEHYVAVAGFYGCEEGYVACHYGEFAFDSSEVEFGYFACECVSVGGGDVEFQRVHCCISLALATASSIVPT